MIAKARLISLTLFMAPLATIRCFCVAVTLGWDPSPDAVAGYALHYAVYGDSQTRMVDIGTTTLATIIDLAPGQTYVFYATAYNQDKIESDPSNVITYTAGYSTNTSHFVKLDTSTRGNWTGLYGAEGNWVVGAAAQTPLAPAVTAPQWTWTTQPVSPVAPYLPNGTTNRIAACWYSSSQIAFNFALNDQRLHRISMYCMDWTSSGRKQRVDLIDLGTGAMLDTRFLTSFSNGIYLTWDMIGSVGIRVTPSAVNAVVSAMFFDPIPATTDSR